MYLANKQKGFVSIKLDKQRKLKFTFNALCELEDLLGKGLPELEGNIRFKDLRALVWAGLLHEFEEDAEWTPEKSGELIDKADGIKDVSDAVSEAIQIAMGVEDEVEVADGEGN